MNCVVKVNDGRVNINSIIKYITSKAVDIIYPYTCPLCGKVTEIEKVLCNTCETQLKYIEEPICKKCGKQLENDEQEYCGDCKRRGHVFDSGIGIFAYDDNVRRSIYDFKYNDMKIYGKFYGIKMAARARGYIEHWKPDVIAPVPVSKKKYRKRGYNQAELIARELAKNCNVPMDARLLYRVKDTKPQKEISKDLRRKNLEKAFLISQNVVKYKKVVLVDDIYTTGSTIDECAKALKAAGVENVFFISLSIGAGV